MLDFEKNWWYLHLDTTTCVQSDYVMTGVLALELSPMVIDV